MKKTSKEYSLVNSAGISSIDNDRYNIYTYRVKNVNRSVVLRGNGKQYYEVERANITSVDSKGDNVSPCATEDISNIRENVDETIVKYDKRKIKREDWDIK